jgi:hypothetical protein
MKLRRRSTCLGREVVTKSNGEGVFGVGEDRHTALPYLDCQLHHSICFHDILSFLS